MKKLILAVMALLILIFLISYVQPYPLRYAHHVEKGTEEKVPVTDTDYDTIPDIKEKYLYFTNETDPDTDSDGMPDGWEVKYMSALDAEAGKWHPTDPKVLDRDEDWDSDGLTNIQEYLAGTHPSLADTDNDGMPDGWECRYGLNPIINDSYLESDKDDLTNLEEYRNGTDPHQPDTDRDRLLDGHNVTVNITAESDLYSYFMNFHIVYIDHKNGTVTFIGELSSGTDPTNPDTDADGMPDGWECQYGLNPIINDAQADKDNDGLINIEEYNRGTDPTNPDTDSDDMADGWEVQYNLNPLIDDSSRDEDSDALTNLEEYMNGTNPRLNDTDKDGFLDGIEVKGLLTQRTVNGVTKTELAVTDPKDPDTDNDGLIDGYNVTVNVTAECALYYYFINLNISCKDNGYGSVIFIGELSVGTNATNADTDGDGLNDYQEIFVYNTNATASDTDYDGLSDFEEIFFPASFPDIIKIYPNIISTDPCSPDTDGDELLDGEEVKSFTNRYTQEIIIWHTSPINPDTDGDGITDGWEAKYAKYKVGDYWNIDPRVYDSGNDADNDGLTNIREYNLTTDPNEWDTDGDGMPDGWEVKYQAFNSTLARYTLDPKNSADVNQDIDNDGVVNLNEYLYNIPAYRNVSLDGVWWNGTNPNTCDTDGDSMPDGWECYFGFNPLTNDSFQDADNDSMTNLEEYRYNTPAYWQSETLQIGAQTVVRLIYGIWWNGTNPKNPDTDSDGMPDGWEYYWGLNPIVNDSDEDKDSDWLTNVEEYRFNISAYWNVSLQGVWWNGTDPTNPDCDYDGLPDGNETKTYISESTTNWTGVEEFEHYTNPLNPDTDGDSFADGYNITTTNDTWLYQYLFRWNILFILNPNGTGTFIGELSVGTNPLVPDANADNDGDGLTNWQEINIYYTDPNNPDTDNDSLWDGYNITVFGEFHIGELSVGTNATKWDTDFDSMPDGWEYYCNLNPLNASDASEDPDLDRLTNLQEYWNGTDPHHPDTDRDRLLDGYNITVSLSTEKWLYDYFISYLIIYIDNQNGTVTFIGELSVGTDPLSYDSDNDGIGDGEEVEGGTDPNNDQSPGTGAIRYPTQITILNISPLKDFYYKGEHFNVTGRVVNASDAAKPGIANIVVKIYLNQSGISYFAGEGATNETGFFSIECIIPIDISAGNATVAAKSESTCIYSESWTEWIGKKALMENKTDNYRLSESSRDILSDTDFPREIYTSESPFYGIAFAIPYETYGVAAQLRSLAILHILIRFAHEYASYKITYRGEEV